jgi:hypothetical protein
VATSRGLANKTDSIVRPLLPGPQSLNRETLSADVLPFPVRCWILLKTVQGVLTVTFTFNYQSWTGWIKPSLQYFVVLCVLLGFFISLYFTCNHTIHSDVELLNTSQSHLYNALTNMYYSDNWLDASSSLQVKFCDCRMPSWHDMH